MESAAEEIWRWVSAAVPGGGGHLKERRNEECSLK